MEQIKIVKKDSYTCTLEYHNLSDIQNLINVLTNFIEEMGNPELRVPVVESFFQDNSNVEVDDSLPVIYGARIPLSIPIIDDPNCPCCHPPNDEEQKYWSDDEYDEYDEKDHDLPEMGVEITYDELSEEDDNVEQLGGLVVNEYELPEVKSEQPTPQPVPRLFEEIKSTISNLEHLPGFISQNHINLKDFCNMKEPFDTKEDFKTALSLTTLSPGGHKNYMFAWNCPLWSKLGSPNEIFDYLRQRTNTCETPSQFQELYKLFILFFKFNELRGYITKTKDLLTLKDLFDPVKTKKDSISKKIFKCDKLDGEE